jgi:hypothetical protein
LSGAVIFKDMNGDTISSEAGVGLSKPASRFTVFIDNTGTANSGYAVANFGGHPADITMTLRDKTGTAVASKNLSLPAGGQLAKFAAEPDQFGSKAAVGFEGTIEFDSNVNLAAVALRFNNREQDVFTTVPVLQDEFDTALYFPQIADGNGYRTDFILINTSANSATARIEFFDDDGNRMMLPFNGVPAASVDLPVPSFGTGRVQTDGTSAETRGGWARVKSPSPLGGSAIVQTTDGERMTSEAGVAASPLSIHFSVYVESLGSTESGLAICNPTATPVTVTLRLRDSLGLNAGSTVFTLLPFEHAARFLAQWFPDSEEFQGTLEIVATAPVSAVALRFDNPQHNVFATLPVLVAP